jgi:4-hydroxybenzoate polyprenyltransferase
LVLAAVVAARTAAMSTNRVADAAIDAKNPRTRSRPIPAGELSVRAVALLGCAAAAAFVGISFAISPLCGWLSPLVLAVLAGYSLTKRFTSLAHVVLGLSLGLAPAGAWLAVRGGFGGNVRIPILLGLGVLAWVAGFDLIYACQDADHDRATGLHSIPARLGIAAALRLSILFHAVATVLFVGVGVVAGLGALYFGSVGLVALLLAIEHTLVRPKDLSRVNAAFFTVNGWVSVGFFVGLASDLLWSSTR